MYLFFLPSWWSCKHFPVFSLIWCQHQTGNFFFFLNENQDSDEIQDLWFLGKTKYHKICHKKHRVGNSNNLMYSSLLFIGALTSLQSYFCSPVTNLGKKKGSAAILTDTCHVFSQEQNESGTKPRPPSGWNQTGFNCGHIDNKLHKMRFWP